MLSHFSKTRRENLLRVTAPNRQLDLPLSNRITTGTTLLPLSAAFLCASVSPSCFLRLLSSLIQLSYHLLSQTTSFPFLPSIPPFSVSFPHSYTLSFLSACSLSAPESWYKVRGKQRDRSIDPGWISPVYATEMHKRNTNTSIYMLTAFQWCSKLVKILYGYVTLKSWKGRFILHSSY